MSDNGPMAVELRDRYDIGEQVAKDPLVVVVDDFVTPGECKHIINQARSKMKRGRVTLDEEVAYSEGRTGSTAWIGHDATPVIRGLVGRVSELVNIPSHHAESLQIVHYAQTQEYKAHHDAWKVGTDRHKNRTENGGQRLVTALMYLNEVEAGGGTGFPKLDLEVEPVPGRMVIFHNTTGMVHDVHKKSLHGGLPGLTTARSGPATCGSVSAPTTAPAAGRLTRTERAAGRWRDRRPNAKKNRKSQKAARRRNSLSRWRAQATESRGQTTKRACGKHASRVRRRSVTGWRISR